MAKISTQIQDIDQALVYEQSAFTYLPKIAAPNTTITNRAQVTNFAADGMPKFGVDRRTIQQIVPVQGEQGPNGETVYKALNDFDDAARFVGGWGTGNNDTFGQRPAVQTSGSYVEITFYGTGINILMPLFGSHSASYALDGGSTTSFINATYASTIANRNCNQNAVVPVLTTSIGLHTVRIIANDTNLQISGYEVLNSSSSIFLPTAQTYVGGRRLYSAATSTTSYNSGFESGTLGTRGGHVLVYQKADGTIAKAVTPTDSSSAFLTAANHANESVIRVYSPREFGAGRSDDFSLISGTATNAAFTLDDGVTTLTASNAVFGSTGGVEDLGFAATNSYTFTFVGTGLDIIGGNTAGAASSSAGQVTIDGVLQGTQLAVLAANATSQATYKIASGLPYGTHTVKVTRATDVVKPSKFVVYGPSLPSLPSGAVALGDYFVTADSSFTTNADPGTVSTVGALTKSVTREFSYTGTWAISSVSTSVQQGFTASSSTNSSTASLTFFGTGVTLSATFGTAATVTVQVDGSNYTGSATVGTGIQSGTWTPGTSTWVLTGSNGSLLSITGLTLGVHKVQVTVVSQTGGFNLRDFEIITPIHAPREIGPARIQNVSLIGSSGVRDQRVIAPQQLPVNYNKPWCQALGFSAGTASSTYAPLVDMSAVIKTSGNPIQINYSVSVTVTTANQSVYAIIFVDGVQISQEKVYDVTTANYLNTLSDSFIVPVSAGTHKVDIYWKASATGSASGLRKTMHVREL